MRMKETVNSTINALPIERFGRDIQNVSGCDKYSSGMAARTKAYPKNEPTS